MFDSPGIALFICRCLCGLVYQFLFGKQHADWAVPIRPITGVYCRRIIRICYFRHLIKRPDRSSAIVC